MAQLSGISLKDYDNSVDPEKDCEVSADCITMSRARAILFESKPLTNREREHLKSGCDHCIEFMAGVNLTEENRNLMIDSREKTGDFS